MNIYKVLVGGTLLASLTCSYSSTMRDTSRMESEKKVYFLIKNVEEQNESFRVGTKELDRDYVVTEFTFSSDVDTTFLFDRKSLCFFCIDNKEDSSLSWSVYNSISVSRDLVSILNKISYSQILVENKGSIGHFFTHFIYMDTTKGFSYDPIYPCDPLSPSTYSEECVKTVRLKPGKPESFRVTFLKNHLRTSADDNEIRLHYLFKPTQEQKAQGFKPLILTSNWFLISKKNR